jgi:steroid delta-isomerase-like uncharacterized protein
MTRSDFSDFFAGRDKAWQDHNVEALTASHTPDGEIESPLFGKLKGETAIRKSYIEWFSTFPDTEFSCEHLLIDGDRVVQFVKITGTQNRDFCGFPTTGKRMQIRGISLYFLVEGKIKREIRNYDFTGVLLQLGLLKAKPAF